MVPKGIGARVILAVLASLPLATCGQTTQPERSPIEVTLSLSSQEMSIGDTIEMRAAATNTTTSEQSFMTDACILVVRFLDASGARITDVPHACNAIGLTHTLQPGESLREVLLFDGRVAAGGEVDALDPGIYDLVAGASSQLRFASEPVALRVRHSFETISATIEDAVAADGP